MAHLLNLLAAIALLVWGTHLVRTGMLQVFGAALRSGIGRAVRNRWAGFACGLGAAALLQSSTATALIASSFVGQGLFTLPLALAIILGADVGTSLMAVMFSFDLSWLSPLLILVGVVLFMSNTSSPAGRVGWMLIGFGLMLLALRLVSSSTEAITASDAARTLLTSIADDRLLTVVVGVLMTVAAYSSLAVVLLTAAMAASGVLPVPMAIALVLGANLGSGILAVLTTAKSATAVRQVPLGNLAFKAVGVAVAMPLADVLAAAIQARVADAATVVVLFHLVFNLLVAVLFIGLTQWVAHWVARGFSEREGQATGQRLSSLDPSALSTPSLAISCAAREALRQADVVETMLVGMLSVIRSNDLAHAEQLRALDDTVDQLYSAIKYYLTKISRETMGEEDSRRWTDIISFAINMEQIGDTVERILIDIEEKKIHPRRSFSDAGMAEIAELHGRLIGNLRLGMSVLLNGSVHDAQKLLEEKARFRDLEHTYAASHLGRLTENTLQSVETSSLHIDLLSDLKRINSHICSVAYPILESAGALAPSRLRIDAAPRPAHDGAPSHAR